MDSNGPGDFLRVLVERTLLFPLHGLTTALVGGALGYGVATKRWWPLGVAFALGLSLHIAWNVAQDMPNFLIKPLLDLTHVRGGQVFDVWNAILGVPLWGATALLVRFARKRRALHSEI